MQDKAKLREEMRRYIDLNAMHGNYRYRPLLIFPEGTCVSNECTLMFHKGAFELDCWVCPVVIKYDTKCLSPYWDTKKRAFFAHVAYICSRWCMPVDVYWLEPTRIMKRESPEQFASRVKEK